MITYRVTDYYSPENDKGFAWDDPDIRIDWPDVADPDTLSQKDRVQPALADLPRLFGRRTVMRVIVTGGAGFIGSALSGIWCSRSAAMFLISMR